LVAHWPTPAIHKIKKSAVQPQPNPIKNSAIPTSYPIQQGAGYVHRFVRLHSPSFVNPGRWVTLSHTCDSSESPLHFIP